MNNFTKTIIVDFDDTICFTKDRDFENGTPNKRVIDTINKLFDQGFIINILTARGQISCNGDYLKADAKYRTQIEAWLKKYCVKYTELSFDKKLAALYVDDKAMLPEDFCKLAAEKLLGGKSGDEVLKLGGQVHKTMKNLNAITSVDNWNKIAKHHGFYVADIKKVIGNTITMDFIERDRFEAEFGEIGGLLKNFAKFGPIYTAPPNAKSIYIDRCCNFGNNPRPDAEVAKFKTMLAKVNIRQTFSHGDFNRSNLIRRFNKIHLIDPISDHNLISSYQLDAAKYIFYDLFTTGEIINSRDLNFAKLSELHIVDFLILMVSHAYRMRKYVSGDDLINLDIATNVLWEKIESYL